MTDGPTMDTDAVPAVPAARAASGPVPVAPPGRPEPPEDDGSEGGGRRANKGVWIRAGIYVIGFHVFAGFIMLLFYFGSHQHH
ncbi:DUF6126 family protein [Streptacidiphilus sp. P02-A3a]|uniref:DUF6126 family protein n=1 Tax=Streptacidiphilus sp. P02-A3a TaxID=2704468 RepID=UPI0015FC78C3|nr:DUF6126 family protein [Streptacidiphilus sp. P02-A3a]QMU66806.1 hypothetical protein GXP74_07755 [Streptacidiphilus sp. P02-A3a]